MSHLFFIPNIPSDNRVVVEGPEAHHAISVLRIESDEEVLLSDGAGNWARANVRDVTKKKFEAVISERGSQEITKPKLTVLQGIPKSDRLKEAIELMVEAGVDEIIPWSATRSISKWQGDSKEKWSNAAFAAAKQSRRFTSTGCQHNNLTSYFVFLQISFAYIRNSSCLSLAVRQHFSCHGLCNQIYLASH